MQNTMITNTLKRAWTGYNFGVSLDGLSKNPLHRYEHDCYFFLKKELHVTPDNWRDVKMRGDIRHCKIYNDKFLDYVVRKTFDTFEEWVTDAGGTMDDVLYGTNRVHKTEFVHRPDGLLAHDGNGRFVKQPATPKYVELKVLLEHLGYKAPDPVETDSYAGMDEDVWELTRRMRGLMEERGLDIDNVWVIANNRPTAWTEFIVE